MSTEYHNGGNTEANEKQGLAALLAQSSTVGVAKTGVLYGLAVTQTATASGSVQVGQGAGVVQPSFTAGASLLTDPAPTVDVFTANPVGALARNDVVVFDSLTAAVKVIVGTANATPTDPTIPNTALPLARLRHAANATTIPTSKIDNLIVYTGLLGQEDTGWQNLDATGDTSGLRRLRRRNGVVWAKFAMTRTNTAFSGDYILLGNLTGYLPTDNGGSLYPGMLMVNGNTPVRTIVDGAAKTLTAQGLNLPVGGSLTGLLSWPLD